MPRIFVRGGHVYHAEGMDLFADDGTPIETARELARARAEAAARWKVIVDLMLAGKRLTGGGRVISK